MGGTLYLLTNNVHALALETLVKAHDPSIQIQTMVSRDSFEAFKGRITKDDCLLSFATGIIVPASVISVLTSSAINIHPASPDYPGRDPHHFAAYDGITRYGATAHFMTAKVDDGAIIDVELEDVDKNASPDQLMQIGESAGIRLAARVLPALLSGVKMAPTSHIWGKKNTRLDFQRLCRISPLDSARRIERRIRAVASERYKNGYIDLHGHRFRLAGPAEPPPPVSSRWLDFTEEAYCRLLDAASKTHRFARFTELGDDRHVIWRHDIDISMNRAHRLATLEHERGLNATYFIQMSSIFYNVMEHDTRRLAKEIAAMGHGIGLHFDISAYDLENVHQDTLQDLIENEKIFLGRVLGCEIEALSFHNPEFGDMLSLKVPEFCGLVNAYSDYLQNNYTYASDSNGYWRFRAIGEIVHEDHQRMHILTHPVWWTPEADTPRGRVERAALGRARAAMDRYDAEMNISGRENIE